MSDKLLPCITDSPRVQSAIYTKPSSQQEVNLSAVDGHNMQEVGGGALLGYKGGYNILMSMQESVFLTVDTTFWCHHNRASKPS